MSTECLMNPEFLIEFIEMYRSFPCLWKLKSSDYSNRQKKADAYDKLVSLCRTVCPTATIELVKNKIANLRTVFKKELKKVESSKRSGAIGDDVYIPRLWYFDLLKFTIEQEVQEVLAQSIATFPDTYDVPQEEENTDDSLESVGDCTNLSQIVLLGPDPDIHCSNFSQGPMKLSRCIKKSIVSTKKKMSSEIFMNPDFLKEFIEMYRSFPCLWKLKCAEYSNRQKKADAYDKLVRLCRTVCPSATIDLVKHKIANLRTVFKKELKKVEASKKSVATGDDVYIPRLWYFDLLKFTIDQDEQSISNFPDTNDVRQEEENTDDSLESVGESTNLSQVCSRARTQEVIEMQHHAYPIYSQKRRKAANEDISRQLLTEAAAVLNQKEDEFDAFGVTVAAKLRKMDDKQKLLSEVLITDILFKGMMKKLTEDTNISLFPVPHYACQPPSCSSSIEYSIPNPQAATSPRQEFVSYNHEYSCSPTPVRANTSFCMSPLPASQVTDSPQYKEQHL